MKYSDVFVESFGYTLPDEIWTSEDIESRLEPVYSRLKLPRGRLELMTGIGQRRFWPTGTRPSQLSVSSCQLAIEAAQCNRDHIGCLIHGSVCRDFLEPATACTVHNHLKLSTDAVIYDVSNACLGILNGMLQAANMIELGQIRAALVVGSEGGRQLLETTIDVLNGDPTLTRKSIKSAVASLTIGSASCAVLLTHRSISKTGNRLVAASVTANTQYHDLCQSHQDQAGSEMAPLMETDSETLMAQGIATGVQNMRRFCHETGWDVADLNRSICHQVGGAHRNSMLQALGIDPAIDFPTYPWLGNTGSAALPVTMAIACEQEVIKAGDRVAMLGIGSGINCIMIGVQWQKSLVAGTKWSDSVAASQLGKNVGAACS